MAVGHYWDWGSSLVTAWPEYRVQSTLTLLCCPGPAPAPAPPPSARPPLAAPVLVAALLLLSYICTSAALLAKINSWAFVESFHFCFMSLLTVRRDPAVVLYSTMY